MVKALQIDRAVDGNLKPVKDSDGTLTALELSTDNVRIKNLEVLGDFTYQPEYGIIRLNDDGTQDTNENNFGLGSTVYGDVVEANPLTSSNIAWDDTNKVFSITKSGIYEVICNCKISINITDSAVLLKVYINTAADTLGTEVQSESFEVDSGDDPVPSTTRWMGRIENGEHIAITINAGRNPYFKAGSTLRILRIA